MSREPDGPWPDGLYDALALVEAFRRDDEATVSRVRVILRHGNAMDICVTLAKLLAEVCAEQKIDAVHMRRWAEQAANRP